MDEYFNRAFESLKKEECSISFESNILKTISNEEAKVLFDTALESLKDPSRKFSTSISKSVLVEQIEADAVVTRIAERAANFISAPLFKLKKQVTSTPTTPQEDKSLQIRLSSSIIDLFFALIISFTISINIFELGKTSLILSLSILPLILTIYLFLAYLVAGKTLGEGISGLRYNGSFKILRGLSLPLFWLSPLVILNILREIPLQDKFFSKPGLKV